MGYITYETMQQLKAVGFSFPTYEHFLNLGMTYYYQGNEYIIGGNLTSEFTEKDKIVAREGCWLPTAEQLLEWFALVEIDVYIQLDASDRCYCITATDFSTGMQASNKGRTLALSLAMLIQKFCKKGLRPYIPKGVQRLKIEGTTGQGDGSPVTSEDE